MPHWSLKARDVARTRKPHRCEWCFETIEAGGAAEYHVCISGGEFCSYYLHPECSEALWEEAHSEGGSDEWTPGDGRGFRPASSAETDGKEQG